MRLSLTQQLPGNARICAIRLRILIPVRSLLTTTNAWRRSREEYVRLKAKDDCTGAQHGDQRVPTIKMFLSEARKITPVNYWEHNYAGNTDDGTRDVTNLLGKKVFDNPKPEKLVRRILEHGCDLESIVVDFFAGSGTTGHSVMLQNALDQGTRRYILVQLPEPLDPSDKFDQRAAADYCEELERPRTIAEVTKERLRRSGAQIRATKPMFSGDSGFRVFKLDTSRRVP